MRAHYPTIVQIVYFVVPVGGAIYGMATHESYGMGLAICGVIGGLLGLITATLLILISAVVLSVICTFKPFDPKKSKN
jgi:tetrahydromethanopterin S-methyltransferase subunit D